LLKLITEEFTDISGPLPQEILDQVMDLIILPLLMVQLEELPKVKEL
jgi:hypothetical protein